MIKIAHRGNINGPDVEKENTIEAIFTAIGKDFDVEVDVWVIDGIIYFGHDEPQRIIDNFIIDKIGKHGWFHCKNLEALEFFDKQYKDYKYFWHQTDDYTLTSNGYIWSYPGSKTGLKSISVDLDLSNYKSGDKVAGICTDFPSLL
jgi:glycerophosphoryl diester phosphodiesterase